MQIARYSPHAPRFPNRMGVGPFEFNVRDTFELIRLNRALDQLMRPTLSDVPQCKELIERLWSRKRELLGQARAIDSWGPPPVA